MAENPNPNRNATGNQRKTTKNSFFRMRNRLNAKRDTGPRPTAVSMVIPSDDSSSSPSNSSGYSSQSSYETPPRAAGYSGWNLYFPETSELYTFLSKILPFG